MDATSWEEWPLRQDEERKNFVRLLHSFNDAQLFQEVVEFWDDTHQGLWELGYWNDYYSCSTVALDAAKSLGNLAVIARIMRQLGWSHMEWNDFSMARRYMSQSLDNARLSGDMLEECDTLRFLGVLCHRWRRLQSASVFYNASLSIINSVKNRQVNHIQKSCTREYDAANKKWKFQAASIRNLIGCLYLKLNRLSESLVELNLSLQEYIDLGESYRYYQAAPLLNIGKCHFAREEFQEALDKYNECYEMSQSIGRVDTAAGALLLKAQLLWEKGGSSQALGFVEQVIAMSGNEIISVRERAFALKYRIRVSLNLTTQ